MTEDIQEEQKGVSMETQEMNPDQQAYVTGLMKMIHDPQASPKIVDTLGAAPPNQSVPHVALMLNEQFEVQARSQGKVPDLNTLLAAGIYLVTDLVELGNTAGAFKVSEEEIGPIIEDTLQQYIEKGLKKGTIDPVELQESVEPLMNEEQKQLGLQAGAASGVPPQADQSTAMEAYARQRAPQLSKQRPSALQGGMR